MLKSFVSKTELIYILLYTQLKYVYRYVHIPRNGYYSSIYIQTT